MKKIFKRLIVFFVGLPLLLLVVFFFPQFNHLLLNLIVTTFSILGALELKNILSKRNLFVSLPAAVIFGAIAPVAWIFVVSFGFTSRIVPAAFILVAAWLLVSEIFMSRDNFDSFINRITTGFAMMIYPGLFMAWIIRLALFDEASFVILIYFLIVLLNDAIAWATGNLFGKNNRGLFHASPNKSIAGFAGGLAASVLTGIAAAVYIPDAFTSPVISSIPAGAILGFCAGAAASLGDLGESAIKRSAGVKDSGSLILGRGGALDSIDSLLLAAPVYYILYEVLFQK